ncbi:hypothetical protein D3C81_2242900 [compost metagenome]
MFINVVLEQEAEYSRWNKSDYDLRQLQPAFRLHLRRPFRHCRHFLAAEPL